MVDMDRSNRVDYTLQRGRLQALYDRWRPSKIIAESNSIGEPIVEELLRAGLPVSAFNTTNASKAAIIEGLALAFEQGTISILSDPILLGELQAFAAEPLPGGMLRYAAPGSGHDDTVMALALAWSVLRESYMPYGLLTFMQAAETEGTEEFIMVNRTNQPAAVKVDTPKACPQCQATCVAPVCSGGFRCSQCGEQFEAPPREKHHQHRGEYLAR